MHFRRLDASPRLLTKSAFVEAFGGVFEHSPWIAERAYERGLTPAQDSAGGMHAALVAVFRAASGPERLGVLQAHPDLAGRLAAARRLTAGSTAEQAAAGLDALTDEERAAFTRLNAAYRRKFGFPFIIAVRDHCKVSILGSFRARLENDRDTEFETACEQVERITYLRLEALFQE